jgi:predicted alpha/beta superfamily hydrolase
MKYSSLSISFAFCIAFSQSHSQVSSADIIIGKAYQLPSELLGENVTVQISVPNSYSDVPDKYPVLYILDGQWFFPHALSIRSDYTQRNGSRTTPEFIVVGITTDNSKRWEWAMEKTAQFLTFLEKELLPFVDANYRTSKDRLLFGWETTGGLVIKTLRVKPDLFDAYLAASPAPLYGTYFPNLESEHLAFAHFLENCPDLDKYLFIGEGEADYPVQYGTASLITLLNEKASGKLRWQHEIMKGVSHQMSAYNTLQQGLRAYYHHYNYLTYNNKAEFIALGGLEYMDTFYKERSDKSGIEDDSNFKHATRRNLSFVAISEDDYEWFDSMLTTFKGDSLFEKSFAPHLNDYAQFYLKHKNPDKALELISYVIRKYPDNAQGFNSLGDLNVALNKLKEAQQSYQKAVDLGIKNNDWRLPEYKSDLTKSANKK